MASFSDKIMNVDVEGIGDTVKESQSIFMDKIHMWGKDFYNLLPNFMAALLLFIVIIIMARLVRRSIILWSSRNNNHNLGDVLGAFVKWGIIIWGALICLTIITPSMKPADVLSALGIGSIALGFALKDILQNWFAGMLLLLKRPFNIGDMVTLKGHDGIIERIESRSTLIKTYDGRRVIVPNADVYSSVVVVHSAHGIIRGEFDIQIAHSNDFAKARKIINDIIASISAIELLPAPEIYITDITPNAVIIRVRFWVDHRNVILSHMRSSVLELVKSGFEQSGINLPQLLDANIVR